MAKKATRKTTAAKKTAPARKATAAKSPKTRRQEAEKLAAARPATLARAARIPGMTPAALSLLLVQARKELAARPRDTGGAVAAVGESG